MEDRQPSDCQGAGKQVWLYKATGGTRGDGCSASRLRPGQRQHPFCYFVLAFQDGGKLGKGHTGSLCYS